MSPTILDIYNDGLALLGIYNSTNAPATAKAHVLNDITAALQQMQMAGEDFYARENYSLSLIGGQNSYSLPETVQEVLDPARLSSGVTLTSLKTRSELDNFGPMFMGTLGAIPQASPMAYFVECLRDDSGADATQINFWVVPTPAANDTLALNVINDPPLYTSSDLTATPPPTPPVPHKYHESILLPLVRMNVTTCELYTRNRAGYDQIKADYLRALTLLGLADPSPNSSGSVNAELKTQASSQSNKATPQ